MLDLGTRQKNCIATYHKIVQYFVIYCNILWYTNIYCGVLIELPSAENSHFKVLLGDLGDREWCPRRRPISLLLLLSYGNWSISIIIWILRTRCAGFWAVEDRLMNQACFTQRPTKKSWQGTKSWGGDDDHSVDRVTRGIRSSVSQPFLLWR